MLPLTGEDGGRVICVPLHQIADMAAGVARSEQTLNLQNMDPAFSHDGRPAFNTDLMYPQCVTLKPYVKVTHGERVTLSTDLEVADGESVAVSDLARQSPDPVVASEHSETSHKADQLLITTSVVPGERRINRCYCRK